MGATPYTIALPNKGITENKPDEFLADAFSPYSRNMQFYNENCQGRYGVAKFVNIALNGPIVAKAELIDVLNNRYEVFCTPYDLYSYDFVNARFDILTPTYTTGTIEVQAGTPTKLRGTGTTWSTNLKAGDYVKIGAGSINTAATWYKVASVDSNTLLTTTTSMPTTSALTAYVSRKTFDGLTTTRWDWCQFTDDVHGEVLLLTNGRTGGFVYWTGSGQVAAVTGTPAGWTACRYLSAFAGRALMGYTTEGGSDQRQRVRWSAVANCLSWPDASLQDFVDEPTSVTGFTKFNGYHIVFKERQAYVGRYIGGDYVFGWEISAQAFGTPSFQSIATRNDYIYYYAHDKKFHRFNLLQDDIISEPVFPETREFEPTYESYIAGYIVSRANEIRWFCPYGDVTQNNYVFVWNYQQSIPQVWKYEHADACCSFGSVYQSTSLYFDDPTFGEMYFDDVTGYFDDSTTLANAEIVVYGGYDGYIRVADSGLTDDEYEYTRALRLKRLNFGLLDKIKRLWKQQIWLEAEASGDVVVRMYLNDKSSPEGMTHTISLIPSDTDRTKVKANITWDKMAQNFQPEFVATNHFALLAVLNWFMEKRSTVRAGV